MPVAKGVSMIVTSLQRRRVAVQLMRWGVSWQVRRPVPPGRTGLVGELAGWRDQAEPMEHAIGAMARACRCCLAQTSLASSRISVLLAKSLEMGQPPLASA